MDDALRVGTGGVDEELRAEAERRPSSAASAVDEVTSFSLEAGRRSTSGRSWYTERLAVRSKTATEVPEPAMP